MPYARAFSFWLHASIDEPMSATFAHHWYSTCCKNLQGNQGVTDEGMAHLGSMWGLKSLELQFCWQLTDAGQTRAFMMPVC